VIFAECRSWSKREKWNLLISSYRYAHNDTWAVSNGLNDYWRYC